jgi:7,8-dihydro-6-hydroxymethylpterin dimethyltransferase
MTEPTDSSNATLGMTHSTCPTCRAIVPAKVLAGPDGVSFRKFCPACGQSDAFVYADTEAYLAAHRYVKPAWRPLELAGDSARACPTGCGFCDRHEQHLCMPIVEITTRCDLACPVCIARAGGQWDMSPDQFAGILDRLLAAEKQIDVLNLSGGEPLLHPHLPALLDAAAERKGIIRVSISTNGLALLERPGLLADLHRRNVVVSLQMDGFADRPYEILRGRPLLAEKRRILAMLQADGITTSMTMTAGRGVNEDQFPAMLEYLFAHEHVVSLMVQPVAYAGRGETLEGRHHRLTIPDVIRLLGAAGHPAVRADDFAPLPCSHPLCFSLAFYLALDCGGAVALNRMIAAGTLMDTVANRTVFGLDADEYRRLQDLVYELWSGPAGSVPDAQAVIETLRGILREMTCSCFDPRKAFHLAERRVKSIFIHAFQDVDTFDLARVRRCCNAYPQLDGTLSPACVHNVLRRGHG